LGISCPHMVCGSYFLNILPTISHENETQKVTLIAAIVTTLEKDKRVALDRDIKICYNLELKMHFIISC